MSKDLIINGLMELHQRAVQIQSRVKTLEAVLLGEQPANLSGSAFETFGTGLIGEVRTATAMMAQVQQETLETLGAIEAALFPPEPRAAPMKSPATSRPAMPKAKPLDPEDPLADFTEEARKSLFTPGAI